VAGRHGRRPRLSAVLAHSQVHQVEGHHAFFAYQSEDNPFRATGNHDLPPELSRGQPGARPCLTSSSGGREPTPCTSTPTIRSAPCKASSIRCAPSIAPPRTNNSSLQRLDKTFTDYQAQANRPFEHEARLKELLARQAQLNAALDLDKSDAQAAETVPEPDLETAALPSRTRLVIRGVQPNPCQPRSCDPATTRRRTAARTGRAGGVTRTIAAEGAAHAGGEDCRLP
jgi:hypothetical protein